MAAKTGVDLLLASRPDPEVVAKPKRRTYTAEYKLGILEALTPQKRGPKSKRHPMDEENQKLRRQNARLAEDLRTLTQPRTRKSSARKPPPRPLRTPLNRRIINITPPRSPSAQPRRPKLHSQPLHE